jgi:hypothetical protein
MSRNSCARNDDAPANCVQDSRLHGPHGQNRRAARVVGAVRRAEHGERAGDDSPRPSGDRGVQKISGSLVAQSVGGREIACAAHPGCWKRCELVDNVRRCRRAHGALQRRGIERIHDSRRGAEIANEGLLFGRPGTGHHAVSACRERAHKKNADRPRSTRNKDSHLSIDVSGLRDGAPIACSSAPSSGRRWLSRRKRPSGHSCHAEASVVADAPAPAAPGMSSRASDSAIRAATSACAEKQSLRRRS